MVFGQLAGEQEKMYYQQRTTKLMGMGPAPIDPGPDLVCRMAAKSFAQARVQYAKDLKSHKHTGMATMAWAKTMAMAYSNGC
mmetsp:Transcript_20177/g.39173  ORF Transcript_20177/g.39173 Transcript_20177/m.39173 type:complete len:82 (+) Transcript_20177:66-311(+)